MAITEYRAFHRNLHRLTDKTFRSPQTKKATERSNMEILVYKDEARVVAVMNIKMTSLEEYLGHASSADKGQLDVEYEYFCAKSFSK
jgi:hypothetical protein